MAELITSWSDGENISITYNGNGDGTATFTASKNEGLDREMQVTFSSIDGDIIIPKLVKQLGRREIYNDDFVLSDGGTFNVLKDGL